MLHNIAIDKHFNCDAIYIPFTRDELCADTVKNIEEFTTNSASKGEHLIELYHGECNLSCLSKNSKIYVLGHGLDVQPNRKWSVAIADDKLPYDQLKHLPFYQWAYSITGGKNAISIDTVAERMIADGLLESDHLKIKLFFCDLNNKAEIIAKNFLSNFKDCNNSFTVDYYPNHNLYNPNEWNGKIHKWAIDNSTGNLVRASSIKQSFFSKKYSNDANCPQEFPELSMEICV